MESQINRLSEDLAPPDVKSIETFKFDEFEPDYWVAVEHMKALGYPGVPDLIEAFRKACLPTRETM